MNGRKYWFHPDEGWTTVLIYKARLIRSDEEDIPKEKAKKVNVPIIKAGKLASRQAKKTNVPIYKARLVESDEEVLIGPQEVREEQVHGEGIEVEVANYIDDTVHAYEGGEDNGKAVSSDDPLIEDMVDMVDEAHTDPKQDDPDHDPKKQDASSEEGNNIPDLTSSGDSEDDFVFELIEKEEIEEEMDPVYEVYDPVVQEMLVMEDQEEQGEDGYITSSDNVEF